MSSFEEPSSAKSLPLPSLDSNVEPSPEPRTPKEGMIHPSELSIEFEDYGRTLNLCWHKNHTSSKVSFNVLSKELSMEVKHSSEAIQILSPSTTMPCSLKGTNLEALHSPIVRTSIMLEFLVETLLGKIPLVPTNKLFKSPLRLFFECCGIARAM
jgi:hypothetical protein